MATEAKKFIADLMDFYDFINEDLNEEFIVQEVYKGFRRIIIG